MTRIHRLLAGALLFAALPCSADFTLDEQAIINQIMGDWIVMSAVPVMVISVFDHLYVLDEVSRGGNIMVFRSDGTGLNGKSSFVWSVDEVSVATKSMAFMMANTEISTRMIAHFFSPGFLHLVMVALNMVRSIFLIQKTED